MYIILLILLKLWIYLYVILKAVNGICIHIKKSLQKNLECIIIMIYSAY